MLGFGVWFFVLLVVGEAGFDAMRGVSTALGDGVDGRVVVAGYERC